MPEEPEIMEFKCPACGSGNRLAGSLAEKVKESGWMRPDLNFYASIVTGVVLDQQMEPRIPIGSSIPGYHICLDVCLDCGCYYAAKVEIIKVVKSITLGKPPMGPVTGPSIGPFSPS
jgi:hypothetical protein